MALGRCRQLTLSNAFVGKERLCVTGNMKNYNGLQRNRLKSLLAQNTPYLYIKVQGRNNEECIFFMAERLLYDWKDCHFFTLDPVRFKPDPKLCSGNPNYEKNLFFYNVKFFRGDGCMQFMTRNNCKINVEACSAH